MSAKPQPATPPTNPATRVYESVCLGALLVVGLGLLQREFTFWSILPVLIGIAGVTARWRLAPLLVVLSVGFILTDSWLVGRYPRPMQPLEKYLLCGGLLAYIAAQLRLQGLAHGLVPRDPRKHAPRVGQVRRDVAGQELIGFAIALAACIALATAMLAWLPDRWEHHLGISGTAWHLLILAWLLGLSFWISASLLKYLDQKRMLPDLALLYLQDQLWEETRREQRRPNRWLAWVSRLRQKKQSRLP